MPHFFAVLEGCPYGQSSVATLLLHNEMAHLRGFLGASTCRRQSWRDLNLRDDGLVRSMRKGFLVPPRVFLSYYEYAAYQRPDVGTSRPCGVRKKMVPLIKLVHPDLFAQYPSNVASTNSKSLKDLNTLIDAAEALEGAANGAELLTPPSVDPRYSLNFFHHKPDLNGHVGEQERTTSTAAPPLLRPLAELRAELRFAPALSANPAASLRGQLTRQLEGLLTRAKEVVDGGRRGFDRGVNGFGVDASNDIRKEEEDRMMAEGVRVHEGETEEDFYGAAFGGTSRRSSARDGAHETGDGEKTMTSEEVRKMTIEHAADNLHENRWDAGYQFGCGFFGGGLMAAARGGAEAALQARSRLVDDLLRSGRVQFAGVPVSREASALRRLHQALVKNFEHLELHDRGLWSTVMLVLRARSVKYEVQVHSGGPIIIFPEKFTEKNLVLFLSETMLSYG